MFFVHGKTVLMVTSEKKPYVKLNSQNTWNLKEKIQKMVIKDKMIFMIMIRQNRGTKIFGINMLIQFFIGGNEDQNRLFKVKNIRNENISVYIFYI